jgi:hypothetical protein
MQEMERLKLSWMETQSGKVWGQEPDWNKQNNSEQDNDAKQDKREQV